MDATGTAETDGGSAQATRSASIMIPLLLLSLIAAAQTIDPPASNIALVDATKDLSIPSGALSLAASISTLAAAATVITSGFLADKFGRRRVLTIALAVSVLGGLTAAAAVGTNMYLLGRAVAGAGLGAAFSASFAYVRTVAGEERFGSALGRWTAQLTLITVVGEVAAGFLTQNVNWRAAMLVVPSLCLISLLAVPRLLPIVDPVDQEKPDYIGQVLLFFGVVGTLYGVANMANTLTGLRTLGPLLGGLAALAAFALFELRSDHPVFPIRLFAKKAFIAAVLIGMLWNFVDGAVVLQLSNLWQYVLKYSTTVVSLGQLPMAAATIVGATIVGKRLNAGARITSLFFFGVATITIGIVSVVFVHNDSPYFMFLAALVFIGLGLASFNVPSASLFVSQAPPESYGVVTASRLMVGQFGYSLATAMSTLLVNGMTEGGVTKRLQQAGVPNADIGSAYNGVNAYVRFGAERPSTDAGQKALAAAAPSYTHAFIVTMLIVGLLVIVVGLTGAWLVRGMRLAEPGTPEKPSPAETDRTEPGPPVGSDGNAPPGPGVTGTSRSTKGDTP